MGMAKTLEELRGMSTEDLIRAYDRESRHTGIGTKYYLDELVRRDSNEQTQAMIRLTRRLEILTWVIALLTLVNAVAAVLMFFR